MPVIFRRWLRRRQLAQEFVEFGLIVVGVGIVGMVGLKVIGRAEQEYFIPLQTDLAPTAPVGTGDVVHATSITMSCDHVTLLVGKTTNCTVTVTDAAMQKRSTPGGTISLAIDDGSTAGPCSLTPVTGTGNPPVTSQCIVSWSPGAGDVGARTATAVYTPNDGTHNPPSSPPQVAILVQPLLSFGYNCANPYFAGGKPWNVEPGHPLVCSVTVFADSAQTTLYNQPLDVSWTPQPGPKGDTYLYCPTGVATCTSAVGFPAKNAPITCHTVPSSGSTCSVIFRRSFNDQTQVTMGPESIEVSALTTDNPADNMANVPINIELPQDEHPVQSMVSCSGPGVAQTMNRINAYPSVLDPTYKNKLELMTAATIDAPAGVTLTCTLAIMDLDPNQATNQYGCPWPTIGYCNPDNGDAHPPLGNVTFVDQTNTALPVSTSPADTCYWSGLGHQGFRPTGTFDGSGDPSSFGAPLPAAGKPEYVSWCTAILQLPSSAGVFQLSATYNAETGYPWGVCKVPHQKLYLGVVGGCASQTSPNTITVTLH